MTEVSDAGPTENVSKTLTNPTTTENVQDMLEPASANSKTLQSKESRSDPDFEVPRVPASVPRKAHYVSAPRKRLRDTEQPRLRDVSRLSSEIVQVIAESNPNCPKLSDEAASALAPDVEYRVREIVQDAVKFMRHSQRRRLTPNDVNAALRLRNVDPLYGFGQSQARVIKSSSGTINPVDADSPSNSTSAENPSSAAANLNADAPAFLTEGSADSAQFSRVEDTNDLFYVEDAVVNVKSLVSSNLSAVPRDFSVAAHWLAIDGVQPVIPQNPAVAPDGDQDSATLDEVGNSDDEPDKISNALRHPLVKPRVRHVLGKELQLYYNHVTNAIGGENSLQRDACFLSLSEESGLVQLLPYFTLFIRESVHKSLKDLPFLFSLMRMTHAILSNPHFHVENYLHQLLPPVLTCLVGKRLCSNPRENHWVLRDFAAEIVSQICAKYSGRYSTVQPRITKTLKDALFDSKRPLTTHYGALVGLGALGVHVVDLLVMPHMQSYAQVVLARLDEIDENSRSPRRLEASKVYAALGWVVNISLTKTVKGTLQLSHDALYSNSDNQISSLLPAYDTRISRLKDLYGHDLFPHSVVATASSRHAQLIADRAATTTTEAKDPTPGNKQNGRM